MFSVVGMKMAGEMVARQVTSGELGSNTGEKRIDRHQKVLWRKAAKRTVPQPLVAHGTDGARSLGWVGDTTENRGYHVAMFEGGDELRALLGVVAQPMKKFGEAPFGRVRTTAPVDDLQFFFVGGPCDDR